MLTHSGWKFEQYPTAMSEKISLCVVVSIVSDSMSDESYCTSFIIRMLEKGSGKIVKIHLQFAPHNFAAVAT